MSQGLILPNSKQYHPRVQRKRQRIILQVQVKVIDAHGVDTPCQLMRMVGLCRLHLFPRRARCPLAGLSKRQGCLSRSTPEAEIVAADFA